MKYNCMCRLCRSVSVSDNTVLLRSIIVCVGYVYQSVSDNTVILRSIIVCVGYVDQYLSLIIL